MISEPMRCEHIRKIFSRYFTSRFVQKWHQIPYSGMVEVQYTHINYIVVICIYNSSFLLEILYSTCISVADIHAITLIIIITVYSINLGILGMVMYTLYHSCHKYFFILMQEDLSGNQ